MHDRYLITGGAGFIGSHLIDELLARGVQVLCVDAFHEYYDPSLKRANVDRHSAHDNYQLVEVDIREGQQLQAITAEFRPDVVVHLAARAGVRPSMTEPLVYEEVNVRGTLNMLEAARHAGVKKFVNASSSSVYGENRRVPFSERDPLLAPASPYGASKLGAEAMVNVYARQFGFPAASLRFFTVYGPRQRPDMAIAKFSHLMLKGKPIEIYGDGSARRDFTFVEDIVQGIIGAAEARFSGHEVFNLGCSEPVLLNQLIDELEQALGVNAIRHYGPKQPGDVPLTYSDISKARNMFGYAPKTSLRRGLAIFAQSLEGGESQISYAPQRVAV